MRPTKFKDQNVVFAKDQPEYQPLPALKFPGGEGEVISCWKLSLRERIKVLFTGRVWLSLLSFNHPLTPSLLSVDRKELYTNKWDCDDCKNYPCVFQDHHGKNTKLMYNNCGDKIKL